LSIETFENNVIKIDIGTVISVVDETAEAVLSQICDLIVGYYKILVNVDTGSLRDSARKERGGEGRLTFRVRAGGYIINPKTKRLVDYAGYVEDRFHPLQNAVDEVSPEIIALLEGELKARLGDTVSVSHEGNEVVIGVRANTMKVTGDLRELEYILYRTVSLLNRFGLSPDIEQSIIKIQRLILVIRMLHSAIMYLYMSTPYGWLLGGISLVSMGVSASTMADM
jgi:hypothetical protein